MKIKLFIIFMLCQISLFAQTDFNEFIQLFSRCEWNELYSVLQVDIASRKPLTSETANKYMFGKHTEKERRQTIDYPYPTRTPHIRVNDTTYILYHNGYHGKFNTDLKHPSTLTPLARVEFDNDIVMIVLHYKYYDIDLSMINDGYRSNQEVYLFRKSDEQMLSAINFSGGETWTFFLEKDTTITTYEWFPADGDTDPSPDMVLRRIKYKIDFDGYFHQIESKDPYETGVLVMGKVEDTDGWTNVREAPTIKAKIMYKALNGSYIFIEKTENTNWGRVVQCQMGKSPDLIFKYGGYIHLSRVK